jgi:hypothetical protein
MGAIKRAFEEQINTGSIGGDEDYGHADWSDELEAQYWREQPPYPFATDEEMVEINKRIQPKYSDMDVDTVLGILNDPFLASMLREEFDKIYNLKNGYFE